MTRPVARISLGRCGTPKKVDFLSLTPLNPPTKTPLLAHFVTERGPFGRFGVVHHTPTPTPTPAGYGSGHDHINTEEHYKQQYV